MSDEQTSTIIDDPMSLEELQRRVAQLDPNQLHAHDAHILLGKLRDGKAEVLQVGHMSVVDHKDASGIRDLLALHRLTVHVIRDHQRLSQIVAELVGIVATQHRRLAELDAEINAVRQERVAVAVQEQANQLLRGLAELGYSTGEQEFVVRLEEDEQSKVSEQRVSETAEARKTDGKAKLSGVLKLFAGLEGSIKIDQHGIEQQLETAQRENEKTKKVSLSWRIQGVTAPADPTLHADAYIKRLHGERSATLAAAGTVQALGDGGPDSKK